MLFNVILRSEATKNLVVGRRCHSIKENEILRFAQDGILIGVIPGEDSLNLSLRALLLHAQDRLRGEAISSTKSLLRRTGVLLAMTDLGNAPQNDINT